MSNKKVAMSPVLKQILWGGSSISLDLNAVHRRHGPGIQPFFETPALNTAIIFKYPNFNTKSSDEDTPWDATDEDGYGERPVETGIYVPTHHERLDAGGTAIYLRMKNYADLLTETFGLSPESCRRDIALLNVIDTAPSLDPFLLRSSVEESKIQFNHGLWNISDEENEQLRTIIASKIMPIIKVAMNGGGHDSVWASARVDDFLRAIWNPDLPDAQRFVASFGFSADEARSVFNAWKGVTFYEAQVMRSAPKAVELLKWLRSPASVPADISSNRMYEQQLSMFISRTGDNLEEVMRDIRSILNEYQSCLLAFQNNQPQPFREFLRGCRKKYWLMGYCTSAINSVSLIFHQYKQYSSNGRLFFAQMNDMLRQMSVALDRRRDRPSSL